jgi:hypothetical protein
VRVEKQEDMGKQCHLGQIPDVEFNLPWDIAALGLAVAVAAGVCPALDCLAKRLGNADGRASGACDRRSAEGGGPDERHGEAVELSIDSDEEQLMTVTGIER